MISETQMEYGSRVRRQGRSRASLANHSKRFLTMAEILHCSDVTASHYKEKAPKRKARPIHASQAVPAAELATL
jgi:hypothetical protein